MKNKTPIAGLLMFTIIMPLLALFFCGPCQQYERGQNYTDGPFRLPTHQQPVEQVRQDRVA